jgi:hypothetical protein
MTFSGKYQFKTRAEKPIRIAFLYSKLTETDEAFSFTSPVRSWRRMRPLYPVNPLAKQSFYCHEMPDNCGNYATLSDCLIRKLDSKYAPQSGSDAGTGGGIGDTVVALFAIGDNSTNEYTNEDFNILNLLPSNVGDSTIKAGFWDDNTDNVGPLFLGMQPALSINTAILFNGIDFPVSLIGSRVGYVVNARKWNKSAFAEGNIYYWPTGDVYVPPGSTGINTEETYAYYSEEDHENTDLILKSVGAWVTHEASSFICNSNIDQEDWYIAGGGNFSIFDDEQWVSGGDSRYNDGCGYVVFQGFKSQLSDFAALLGQAASYWGLESGITLKVVSNPFGCSTTGDLGGGGLPADPDPDVIPPVTSATYMGRYSEIFVNFQGDGGVKEVKLPIRFPTRATKVQYGDAGFYNKNISPTSGQQPVVAQWTSELFKGVLELDADFIYAKILYAPFREWKAGEKPFAKPANNETSYSHNQNEWTLETRILNAPTASNEYLEATRDVVPQVDWFNKCRVFKIRQSDMTIVEDVTYSRGANQAISQEGWTHEITKDYVLLDHRTEAKYILFIGADDYLSPPNLVVPPTTGKRGYCGTPIIYPQIGLGVDERDRPYGLPPHTFPDFLTPQEFWTDLDWIIYLLSEKPANYFVDYSTVDDIGGYFDRVKNVYFNTPGKYSGYGRTPKHQSNLYIQHYQVMDYTDIESGSGFMDKIVEYNCFLGSAIKRNGLIEKWVRVSPNSFPIPYIRRVQ